MLLRDFFAVVLVLGCGNMILFYVLTHKPALTDPPTDKPTQYPTEYPTDAPIVPNIAPASCCGTKVCRAHRLIWSSVLPSWTVDFATCP
jgi:hypothetical protein